MACGDITGFKKKIAEVLREGSSVSPGEQERIRELACISNYSKRLDDIFCRYMNLESEQQQPETAEGMPEIFERVQTEHSSGLRVLVTSPPFLAAFERYENEFTSRGIEVDLKRPNQYFPESEIKKLIKNYDGIICGDDEITETVLQNAKRLKVISKWGVGIDSIDRSAAEQQGIAVCNSPGAFSDSCADTAMGYLLMLARGLHRTHASTMKGKWEKNQGMLLRGRTMGIIGVGSIGREVAKRGRAFGLNVLGNDIRKIPVRDIKDTGIVMCDREYLLSCSDFVVLACDLNPTSRHLINIDSLQKMKRTAYLINVARGPIVDTSALIEALRERWIGGAALDVFESEPLLPDSPLRLMDNCILGAHNAYNADIAVEFVHRNTVYNLLKHLCPEELQATLIEEVLDEAFNESELAESGVNYVL